MDAVIKALDSCYIKNMFDTETAQLIFGKISQYEPSNNSIVTIIYGEDNEEYEAGIPKAFLEVHEKYPDIFEYWDTESPYFEMIIYYNY